MTALTTRIRAWRARQAAIEIRAEAEVAADEAALRRRKRLPSLAETGAEFWRHPSPWIITISLVVFGVARVVLGGWSLFDLAIPVVIVGTFPITEWLVHVFVLHARPRDVGPLTIDTLLARKHREHHADPRDIPLVFIPWPVFTWLLPTLAAIGYVVLPTTALAATFMVSLSAIGIVYEWTHYLIHSDYKPRSRAYRAVWRNHRLHHYKNEQYWFTVTTAGTADRLFGTQPNPADVETSPTARNLHGAEAA